MAREATERQFRYPAGTATATALSDKRPLQPALCDLPQPVEARLRRIGEGFANPVWLVFPAWWGDDARRKIRQYLPLPSRQYSSGHVDGKPELLDRVGMPFAPKHDEDLGQPAPEDPGPVHPGVAAGAERHQLGVVAGVAVVNI